jgi:carboxylesterase type B
MYSYSPNLDNYPRSKARDSKGMRSVVVVTINYRLGPFAQLYLNQLAEEDTTYKTSGMYNHLDVQM